MTKVLQNSAEQENNYRLVFKKRCCPVGDQYVWNVIAGLVFLVLGRHTCVCMCANNALGCAKFFEFIHSYTPTQFHSYSPWTHPSTQPNEEIQQSIGYLRRMLKQTYM